MNEAPRRIEWQALEHEHGEHSSDWYWGVGTIALGAAILAVYFDNILFGIIIILAAFVAALQAHKGADVVDCEVNTRGVKVNNILYPFANLDSFWVDEVGITRKILVKSNRMIMPYIIMPLGDIDEEPIREFLLGFIPEEELVEPVSQKILEYFGF